MIYFIVNAIYDCCGQLVNADNAKFEIEPKAPQDAELVMIILDSIQWSH